jgi:peptide/nickel transport system substrate-binding protein
MSHHSEGPFSRLFAALRRGEIDRRQFVQGATALGMTASVATWCAGTVAAQDAATPAALGAAGAEARPTSGTENQERGAGGELRIIQWQAPSHLSALQATGDKDNLGAQFVSESLMARLPDATLIPILVKEVPTVDNGLLAEDLTSVTFNLLEGVTWSDGEPFTAEDVRFTWEWVMDDENAAPLQALWTPIQDIEVPDELTAIVRYAEPNPSWPDAFAGMGSTVVYPKHILEGGGQEANDAFRLNPIGTGPYVVESFTPNDQVTYVINENYREPNKPFFSNILLKGGGDPASAARAVLQTAEYEYAWNLAVEPEILRDMESDDAPGVLDVRPGTSVERININFSDPNTEVDGQRSHFGTPHPILSDDAVRMAMRLGIDRQQIADSFYFGGDQEPAVANILVGIPSMASPNQELNFDPDQARQILEDAGWTGDGVRSKDGVELKLRLTTTVNQVRQKTQAVVKSNLEEIGFEIQLEQVDSGIFFDSSPGNDQSNTHFYTDMNMFTSGVGAPPPVAFMVRWYAGPNNEEIAQKENGWAGRNIHRWKNEEYDALYEQAKTESDPERQAELFIQMNDLVIDNNVVIPLVSPGNKQAYSRTLNAENIAPSSFEFDYWNIANWNRVEG